MPTHVDLTHEIEPGMSVYPGDEPPQRVDHATHAADGYRAETVTLTSHTGTHIDAPLHTEADGAPLSAFPPERFVFEVHRVDCRDLGEREPIGPDRLPAAESTADCDMVVVWTGWDAHWGTDRYVDHPFVAPETAAALADRGLSLGLDTLNPDPTPSPNAASDEPEGLAAHHALLGEGCLVVENLTNLDRLGERFELRAYPLALGGDGAPVRAVGVER